MYSDSRKELIMREELSCHMSTNVQHLLSPLDTPAMSQSGLRPLSNTIEQDPDRPSDLSPVPDANIKCLLSSLLHLYKWRSYSCVGQVKLVMRSRGETQHAHSVKNEQC